MKFKKNDKVSYEKGFIKHESAGGFLFYVSSKGSLEVALLKKSGNGYYIPKGHLQHGELPIEAARRELKEELGIQRKIKLITKLNINKYEFTLPEARKVHQKKVHLFVFQSGSRLSIKPMEEEGFERADWLKIDQACKKLMFDKDNLLKAVKVFKNMGMS